MMIQVHANMKAINGSSHHAPGLFIMINVLINIQKENMENRYELNPSKANADDFSMGA